MLKRLRYSCLLLLLCQSILAAPMFNIMESGQSGSINISLCLNAYGPLSCQEFTLSHLTLGIQTTIPHQVYSRAGLKVNTPGYAIQTGNGFCSLLSTGYCPLILSDSRVTTISLVPVAVSNFTVGGTIGGLGSNGLVLKNTITNETLSINAHATSFTFTQTVPQGGSYNVVIKAQPTGLTCQLFNGSGTNVQATISNITVGCGLPTAVAGTQAGHVVLSFDDGATWQIPTSPQANTSVSSVFATENGVNGILYAASGNFVYTSSNLGATWNKLSTTIDNSTVTAIFAAAGAGGAPDIVYAVTANGAFAYITNNTGQAWVLPAPQPSFGALYSVTYDSPRAFIGDVNGKVSVALPPFTNWVTQPALPAPSTSLPVLSLNIDVTGQLYATTEDQNSYVLPFGSPGGWSWYAQTTNRMYVAPISQNIYAGTEDGYVIWVNSSNSRNQLGFVEYTAINGLFFFN